jgi:hypothetical protein
VIGCVAGLRLAVRVRRGKFGSRLLLKLAGIFALVGVLPGLVIYTVSYQFVSRSIEAWFDVRGGRRARCRPGAGPRHAGRAAVSDLANKTALAAERLAELPRRACSRWRWSACASSSAASEVALVNSQRPDLLAWAGSSGG